AGAERIWSRPALHLRGRRPGRCRHPRSRVKLKIPGVPSPTQLRRYALGQPLVEGPVLVGGASGAKLRDPICEILGRAGASVGESPSAVADASRWSAIIFDATGITEIAGLSALHALPRPPSATSARPDA